MKRILLAISLCLLASAAIASGARASDDSIDCPKPGGRSMAANLPVTAPASHTTAAPTAPVPDAVRPVAIVPANGGNHSHGAIGAPRIISPRWHSFLPGMFR
jgi:hypothetical protein